jgi:hypothetical protein
MRWFRILLPLLSLAPLGFADLTPTQKTIDFMQLVALYDVNYAPYELKRDVFGFDLLKIQPWLDQIGKSTTDVDFYDICVRYVASLQDSHDEFTILSDYDAWLHMNGDIYDGKFLIDFIDRAYLPAKNFPFTIGDQLISVDGVAVADLLTKFQPYAVNGSSNPVSRQRLAAATITERFQGWYPLAAVGPTATIVVQRKSGALETDIIPWDITGTLVTSAGVIPAPATQASRLARAARAVRRSGIQLIVRKGFDPGDVEPGDAAPQANPWLAATPDPLYQPDTSDAEPDPVPPDYMAPLLKLDNMRAASADAIRGSGLGPFDNPFPVFNPPAGFKLRLGGASTDSFVSGTFTSGPATIGFIRIPSFAPSSTTTAVRQFSTEIQYFQQNTDGLVVDIMGNGGGSLCYGNTLASYLIPFVWQGVSEQLRASLTWQLSFSSALESAKANGAPAWVVATYTAYLDQIKKALGQNRGRTGRLPLCSAVFETFPPTASGNVLSYTKPVLVLTDNFTLSTAESFTMSLQDNKRATIFGTRTDGGGGNVVGYSEITAYSQGDTRVTEGLIQRLNPVAANGFPASLFYDGVGIQPDMAQDYMTADNLSTGGAAFVTAFTAAIRSLIGK